MATLFEYARIAIAVYKQDDDGAAGKTHLGSGDFMLANLLQSGAGEWACRFWQSGTASNGFQGAILENADEVVVAYKGSKTGITGKQDWLVSDLQIALGRIPNQAHSASEIVEVAQRCIPNKPLSIVGHSLGGGLAQLIGYIRGVPFVTFNGPGMKSIAEKTSPPGGPIRGFNMIMLSDPVGNFGRHIGKTERFRAKFFSKTFAHLMTQCVGALERCPEWGNKTLDELVG